MNLPSEDSVVGELDPAFAQMGIATERHAWGLPRLTMREKVFLSVVADVCHPALGLPFELHVKTGLRYGVTTADIRDVLRYVSCDTGYPAALSALGRLAEIERALLMPPPDAEHAAASLAAAAVGWGSPMPEAVRAGLGEIDGHFAEHMDLQSRMRGNDLAGLGARERAFISLVVDVLYQTLDESFRVHTSRALGVGAEREDVRTVVRFAAQFGVTKAWRAFRALNTYFTFLDTHPVRP